MSISVLEKVSSGIVIQKHPQAASLWHGICMLSHCSNFTDIGVGPSCTWFNVCVEKTYLFPEIQNTVFYHTKFSSIRYFMRQDFNS